MGDRYETVKVAAVQAASVFLDRAGSTDKACSLIREAGRNGARVIGFPEGFIPAHPVWYHHHVATGAIANRLSVELFKNAMEIPGPETAALCAAARAAGAYVVVGVCEKIPNTIGTLFNTQLYIGPDGTLIGKHQKIMPTVGERLVHTGGHGDTFTRHELAEPFSNERRSDAQPRRRRLAGLCADEQSVRRVRLRHGRRGDDREA